MATEGTKINDALPKVNLSGTEEYPVNDGGNDRKVSTDSISNYSITKQFNKPITQVLDNNDKFSVNGTSIILWSKFKELIQGLVNSFIGLSDTPSSYSGQSGKFVKVNDTEDGLEFNQPTTDEIQLPRDPSADHLIHLKELQSHDSSPFISDGGEVTDKGDGTIDITEAEVWIKTANLLDADFKAVVVPAKNIAIPENQNYIIYVDYNSGTPQFSAMASAGGYFYQNWDKLPFATCVNIVSKIIINTFKDSGTNAVYKNILTQLNFQAIRYLGGLTPSEVGTRNVAIGAGAVALSNDYKGIAPLNTSTGGTFTRLYVTNGVWTRTTGQTQVSNTQYNNITTGLVAIGNNKWANKFLYYIIDSPNYWALLEGQQEFNSLAEAQAASIPASRPAELSPFYAGALLVAKFTVQQGLTNFASIQNPFTTTFSGGGVGISEHNLLTGLQGGEAGQYFHLNSLFYTAVLNNYLYNAAKSFKITQNQESLTADRTITWQDKNIAVAGLSDLQTSLRLQFDTTATASDPGAGKFRINAGATELYISDTEYDNGNIGDFLNALSADSVIGLKAIGNRAKWANIKVTSVTYNTGWWTIVMTVQNKGTDFALDDIVGVSLLGVGGATITGTPKKIVRINDAGDGTDETSYDYDQVVQVADIDVSDISEGESKILIATKTGGVPTFGGAISQLDKLGSTGLDTLLAETAAWDGDEITLTGNNLAGALGENSQEYYIGSDFFLCISHTFGTDATNGTATWRRNRGQDALTPGLTNDDAIITELEASGGWSVADFKQITTKSKQGTWYRASSGGFLYMCIDKNNGWTRIGTPNTIDLEITATSHPTLTASLTAHTWTGYYLEGTNPSDEVAEQGQKWRDTANYAVYERFYGGYWAKIV